MAQCPDATITKIDHVTDVTFDSFGELISGITVNGFSISVTAPTNTCPWDLYVLDPVTITKIDEYSTQVGSVDLPLSSINVRAFNLCATPDQDYGAGIRVPPDITGSFAAAFNVPGRHYVIGTAGIAPPDGVLIDNQGACAGIPEINDNGNPSLSPTTHVFRFDFNIVPDVAAVIRPGLYRLDVQITIADDATDLSLLPMPLTYSLTIEILPILQLKMTSTPQLDFDFNEIKDYTGGITKYGATKIQVNSSVNWDLIAVGTSTLNENVAGSPYWDNNVSYTGGGTVDIPLDVLELFQSPANPTPLQTGVGLDYSPNFTNPPSGNNNIEVARGSGVALAPVAPYTLGKTIAGNWGALGVGNMMAPGSYLSIHNAPAAGFWNRADFSYSISYRIVPGLPVLFPHTLLGPMPRYARPGVYSMQVKYILAEDQ